VVPRNLDAAYRQWVRNEPGFRRRRDGRDQHERKPNGQGSFGLKRGSGIAAALYDDE
jgi:hypothetical protein